MYPLVADKSVNADDDGWVNDFLNLPFSPHTNEINNKLELRELGTKTEIIDSQEALRLSETL